MTSKARAQIGLEDTIVKDDGLEKMLEEREEAKAAVADYRQKDKAVKDKLKGIESPTPYRVGRFIINRNPIEGHHVEFDTDPSIRLSIKVAGEE